MFRKAVHHSFLNFGGGETRLNVPQVSGCSIHLQPAADKLPALQIYALNDLKRQHSGYTLQTEYRLLGQFVYLKIRKGVRLMAGKDNLRKLTTEQAREIGRLGGKASVEAKRERKALKEELLLLLEQDNRQERISIALLDKAANGDVAAYKLIAEMLGEYQQQQSIDLNMPDITLVKSKCKKK